VTLDLKINVDFQVGTFKLTVDCELPGGLTVLLGPSGCGKSTLLNIVAGLLPSAQGRIQVGERLFLDTAQGLNLTPQQRQIGYVFQQGALFPHLNVHENITFALDRWPSARRKARLQELLSLLQLEDLAERRPSQLSGGQGQRVALARALAPQPSLLLLDEPFSALEVALRAQLGQELVNLQRQLHTPMLLVTHAPDEALLLGDTLVLMQAGKIQAVGKPALLLAQ
jgi:molybdate transport system ATP-binding protein